VNGMSACLLDDLCWCSKVCQEHDDCTLDLVRVLYLDTVQSPVCSKDLHPSHAGASAQQYGRGVVERKGVVGKGRQGEKKGKKCERRRGKARGGVHQPAREHRQGDCFAHPLSSPNGSFQAEPPLIPRRCWRGHDAGSAIKIWACHIDRMESGNLPPLPVLFDSPGLHSGALCGCGQCRGELLSRGMSMRPRTRGGGNPGQHQVLGIGIRHF